jgi:hypothetical protein
MKPARELHQELRQRILNLPGVTEQQNAGIHEDAFFVGRTMFMHIHGGGHCDIRLSKTDQEQVLAEGKARPHRWAPQAGYVTSIVKNEADLEQAMELIRMSHQLFAGKETVLAIGAASRDRQSRGEPRKWDGHATYSWRRFLSGSQPDVDLRRERTVNRAFARDLH